MSEEDTVEHPIDEEDVEEQLLDKRALDTCDALRAAGVTFDGHGWDHYDNSIELYDVPPDARLSVEAQSIVHAAGYSTAYVNHQDRWETHYSFGHGKPFEEVEGWRVSYPHKRGDEDGKIWVEKLVQSWPKEWFLTGYVLVKPKDTTP